MHVSLYWEYNGPELKDTKWILARSMFVPNKGVVNQSFLPEDTGEMITALLCFREDVDFSFTKEKSTEGRSVEGSLPRKAAALQFAWNVYSSLEICPWGTALQMGYWNGWVFFLSQCVCFYILVLSRFLFLRDKAKLIWWSASPHAAGCCANGSGDFQVSQLQLPLWVWVTLCQPPLCPWEHTGPLLSSTSL